MLKPYPNSPLLYEKDFAVDVNNIGKTFEESICYHFDYGERSYSVNMEFPHFHNYYEILILLSPKAYHFVSGKPYKIINNDIVLLRPSVLHQSKYLPGPPSDRLLIAFTIPRNAGLNTEAYREILSVFEAPLPIVRLEKDRQKQVFSVLNEIATLSRTVGDKAIRNLMIHEKFTEFLFLLYQFRKENIYEENTKHNIKEKIYSITNYIHAHYSEDLTLSALSDLFYISPYYLSHQFKQVTGFTVIEYIQQTRIKRAQYLLLNTDEKITDIAEMTGFSSFSHFNRVFKKICDMPPSDYRSRCMQGPQMMTDDHNKSE